MSVQNNVADYWAVYDHNNCDSHITDPQLAIHDSAVLDTVVDYNVVSASMEPAYTWNTPTDLAGFRAASDQAGHDIDATARRSTSAAARDSANSAAPAWPPTTRAGGPRVDDPNTPNTGVGPVTFADRGAIEAIGQPTARATVRARVVGAGASVTVDASASSAWAPYTVKTYAFDFGDGSRITQSSPIAEHLHPRGRSYRVTVWVYDTVPMSSATTVPPWTWSVVSGSGVRRTTTGTPVWP